MKIVSFFVGVVSGIILVTILRVLTEEHEFPPDLR